mmetsp:Transcript_6439/g.19886  ORF Transcript_6439/g.19886 Transcript_6439/m.19886 type:complete len:139 (+) Transcript_6439:714-1130(+)
MYRMAMYEEGQQTDSVTAHSDGRHLVLASTAGGSGVTPDKQDGLHARKLAVVPIHVHQLVQAHVSATEGAGPSVLGAEAPGWASRGHLQVSSCHCCTVIQSSVFDVAHAARSTANRSQASCRSGTRNQRGSSSILNST